MKGALPCKVRFAARPARPRLIGVLASNPEIRILPPSRYPYRIYYTIQGDDVVILYIATGMDG